MRTPVPEGHPEPPGTPPTAVKPPPAALRPLGLVSIWAVVCLGLAWAVLASGQAGPVGLWLKYNYLTAPALVAGVSWALWRTGTRYGAAMITIFLVTITLLILFGGWRAGETNFFFIGGLLPFSDAQGYYSDALRLLHGWPFSEFSSRRPLFPAFLAVLLALTNLSLPLTLIVISVIAALALALAARETERHLGTVAGILMLVCLFMFYRRFVGATLTEHLGFAWGCLAFCFLWRGAALDRPKAILAGLFLLAVGLNARAGALLVLPAIALWAGLRFRGPNHRGAKIAGGAVAAALLGFATSALLLRVVGIPGAGFSNFSYTLYGLVFGGDWSLAVRQHPELAMLSELDRANRVYVLAWEGIRANPLLLASGALRAWGAFLSAGPGPWYSFAQFVTPEWLLVPGVSRPDGWRILAPVRDLWTHLNVAGQRPWGLALQALALSGLIVWWRNRRTGLAGLIAAGCLGILLSVPFAPPWDADNMRAYATTLPLLSALPLLGTGLLRREPIERWGRSHRDGPWRASSIGALSLLLLILQFLGPLGIVAAGWRAEVRQAPQCTVLCATDRSGFPVEVYPDVTIHLFEPAEGRGAHRPGNWVSLQDFRDRRLLSTYPGGMSRGLGPGTTLALAFDLRGGAVYLQGGTAQFPVSRSVAGVCGEVVRERWIQWVRIDAWGRC